MESKNHDTPLLSFCISTYRRPQFLETQIRLLLSQTDPGFEIVISDNDPESSAKPVALSFNDDRVRYFQNETNLGMIRSFNKSIERARTSYITMVTDDDPIDPGFLAAMKKLVSQHPGHSMYAGFRRAGQPVDAVEVINRERVAIELLDPARSPWILWSSCMLRRDDVISMGSIPDYGSPHLADHTLLVSSASVKGAVIINHAYSEWAVHDQNFSKLNLDSYVLGCKGFYAEMERLVVQQRLDSSSLDAVRRHLDRWFISSIFNLKRYYTVRKNPEHLAVIAGCADKILAFPFMKQVRTRFYIKSMLLSLKKSFGLLK